MTRRLVRSGFFLLSVLAAGCGRGPGPRAGGETFPKANVVLISVDTLRSDHLPFYGYGNVETPALAALRNDSILYERAYSHVPLTAPSHASILTGRLPAEHGIHDNLGYRLRRDVPTLAETLKNAGYATGGAVSCFVLKRDSGLSRGFDFYEDNVDPAEGSLAIGRVQRAGAETEKLLERWLDSVPAGRPFFAFLHLYEPHTPYEPPEPYRTRYKDQPYDGEIAAADAVVGSFVAALKAKGLYEGTLLVFLSDHGEGLGDHGEAEHGMFLYREALQVPLLVKLPGSRRAGSSVTSPVALADVFTTVGRAVAAAGFQAPAGTVSLLEAGAPAAPARRLLAETFFPRIHFGWSELASNLEGRWHYIEAPRPEIYDLETDPGENKDRIAERPDALRVLRADLLARRAAYETPGDVDVEARRKLTSLGYLSAGPAPAGGTLDDPKDRIGTFEQLRRGLGDFTAGNASKAHEVFSKLLAENPRMLDVWDMDSKALLQLGRSEEALAALKKTVDLVPEEARAPYLTEVGNLCLQLGRWEEADKHAEILRAMGDPAAEDIAARAALGKGDLAAAEAAARAGLERGSGKARVRACLVLGRIAVLRGDLASARSFADRAQELSAADKLPQSGLHMLRGDVLAREGRAAEAEREFLEELRLYPDRTDARVSLSALYASVNRRTDARRVVIDLISRQPTPETFLLGMRTFRATDDPQGEAELRKEARRRFPADPRFVPKG